MKIFNTLRELWNYQQFCQQCQQNSKTHQITIGPDHEWILLDSFRISEKNLTLKCKYSAYLENDVVFNIIINLDTNSFYIKSNTFKEAYKSDVLFFYIESFCTHCDSLTNSADISFDFANSKIVDIGIERDVFYIYASEDVDYSIFNDYILNNTDILVYKKNNFKNLPYAKMSVPLLSLNYGDAQKLISQIKQILLLG